MNKKLIVKKMIAVACAAAAVAGQPAVMAPSADSSAVITASAAEAEESRSYLGGATLTLTGEIGVNFYLSIPENSSVSTIVMTGPNGEKSYALSDLTPEADGAHQGMYKVTYLVAPAQIEEDISLVLQNNGASVDLYNDKGVVYTDGAHFSVRKYIDAVNDNGDASSELTALVNALDVYGKYASVQFKNAEDPGLDGIISDINADVISKYAIKQSGNLPSGVTINGATLILDSETTYRIYFSADPGAVTIDGASADVKQNDNGYYVELTDIAAPELDKVHTVMVGDCKLNFSALSYAYSVLKNEADTSNNICKLVKALYSYNYAADMYFFPWTNMASTISADDVVLSTEDNATYHFTYDGNEYTAVYSEGADKSGNWKIVDSYRASNKGDMRVICEVLQRTHKVRGRITEYRTATDMADEWESHNKGYAMIAPFSPNGSTANRLKSVDLDKKDQGKTFSDFLNEFLGR